jgi:hypothetical protein
LLVGLGLLVALVTQGRVKRRDEQARAITEAQHRTELASWRTAVDNRLSTIERKNGRLFRSGVDMDDALWENVTDASQGIFQYPPSLSLSQNEKFTVASGDADDISVIHA